MEFEITSYKKMSSIQTNSDFIVLAKTRSETSVATDVSKLGIRLLINHRQ